MMISHTAFLAYSIYMFAIQHRRIVSKRQASLGPPRQAKHHNLAMGLRLRFCQLTI